MQITIKLYAMLGGFIPPESVSAADKNIGTLELGADATIGAVIQQLSLPDRWVHLVLLNGVYIDHESHATTKLKNDDVLAIWPPVAGG